MINVKNDWWKGFFNEVYLITDARSILNKDLTSKEVNLIEEILSLDKNDRILDLCGGHGRHSLELARRGYRDLTVLDYSSYLIGLGQALARKANLKIRFHRADARYTGLADEDFTCVLVMANSFGYFSNDRDNLRILKEIYRILKKNGRLLLDLTDPNYIRSNLKPLSWHEANADIVICRKRELRDKLVKAREIVVSKRNGLIRDRTYCERLCSRENISTLLEKSGFKTVSARRSVALHNEKKDYGLLTSRMMVIARK